ncbi:hypothetical protein [Streptomyces sp. NPDC059649]|uniref:hypothetical protein n=1 Tax=Streptomyces sp. NPDC059649 TaxID=3346895 RepID=UPI00369DAEBA
MHGITRDDHGHTYPEGVTVKTLTLVVDEALRDALDHLATGTDGTPEETARKAIMDAALQTRVDDNAFEVDMARHSA